MEKSYRGPEVQRLDEVDGFTGQGSIRVMFVQTLKARPTLAAGVHLKHCEMRDMVRVVEEWRQT